MKNLLKIKYGDNENRDYLYAQAIGFTDTMLIIDITLLPFDTAVEMLSDISHIKVTNDKDEVLYDEDVKFLNISSTGEGKQLNLGRVQSQQVAMADVIKQRLANGEDINDILNSL